MTRPADIPEDVWEAAVSHLSEAGWFMRSAQVAVAGAILAERERCRGVANERAAQLFAALGLPHTDETKAGWAGQMIEALMIEQRISEGHVAKDTVNIEGLHAAAAKAGFVA